MEFNHIYTLSDPITDEVRYIGQTKKSLDERLRNHLKSKGKTHRHNWINSLIKKGVKPKIELIETVDRDKVSETEIFWISMFKSWGFKLCNLTEGGETSTTTHIVRSKEWCDNISQGKIKSQYRFTDESKRKMSESAKKRGANSKGFQISKLNLNDTDVIKIKQEIKNKGKKTLKELSNDLHLPYTFLLDLNSNRTWKHLN